MTLRYDNWKNFSYFRHFFFHIPSRTTLPSSKIFFLLEKKSRLLYICRVATMAGIAGKSCLYTSCTGWKSWGKKIMKHDVFVVIFYILNHTNVNFLFSVNFTDQFLDHEFILKDQDIIYDFPLVCYINKISSFQCILICYFSSK